MANAFTITITGTKDAIARGDRIIANVKRVNVKLREKLLRKIRDQAINNIITQPVSTTGGGIRYFRTGPRSGIIDKKGNWIIFSGGKTSTLFPPFQIAGLLERGAKPHVIVMPDGREIRHPGFVSNEPIARATRTVIQRDLAREAKAAEVEIANA